MEMVYSFLVFAVFTKLYIDSGKSCAIIRLLKIKHLIKSGGGNGPVKPGNLFIQGAKSGGETKDEA